MGLRLPPRPLLGSILLRTALVWDFIRVLVGFVAGGPGEGLIGTIVVGVGVAPVVLVVLLGDMLRRNERAFLRNAGIGVTDVTAVTLGLIILLEGALLLGVGVAR